MFLDTVHSDTTNRRKYLDKDKTECVDKLKTPIPRRSDAPPRLPRRDDAPHAMLTPLLCRNDAAGRRPSYVASTPL